MMGLSLFWDNSTPHHHLLGSPSKVLNLAIRGNEMGSTRFTRDQGNQWPVREFFWLRTPPKDTLSLVNFV